MSKKTLLEEGSVRHFMKLASLQPLAEEFVSDLYKEEVVEEAADETEEVAEAVEADTAEVVDEDVTEEVVSEEEPAPEMDMEAEEPAPEMDMEAEELSITPEEAEILVKLGQKIAAAGTEEAPAEDEMEMDSELEAPADDMGGEEMEMASEEEEEAPAMRDMYENLDDLVAEVSKRVKERLAAKQ